MLTSFGTPARPRHPSRIASPGARAVGLVLGAAIAAGACTAAGAPSPSPARSFTASPPEGAKTVPPSAPAIVGEVPEAVMLRVRDDLAQRLGHEVSQATLVKAEAVTWNDGSLGCPERGVMYIQVIIEGYQVIVELDGKQYDYRSDGQGNVRLCEPRAPANQP